MIKFFYYPGSKEWLIKNFFYLLKRDKKIFVDLFCGSGIVGLNLLQYYDKIILNDLDPYIYNFFLVLKENNQELYNFLIKNYECDKELFRNIAQSIIKKEPISNPLKSAADYLFFRNFSFRALKTDYPLFSQEKKKNYIKCVELIKKINKNLLNKIEIFNYDGYKFFDEIKKEKDFFVFLDPPYFVLQEKKVNNFYALRDIEKNLLLSSLENVNADFLLTIDFKEDLYNFAKNRNLNYLIFRRKSSYNFKHYDEFLIFNYKYSKQLTLAI